MPYHIKAFRTVKHGKEGESAYCRSCGEILGEGNVQQLAKNHAKQTLHTVDYYKETWTEYTSQYVTEGIVQLSELPK
jgi:hypothetical protein